MRPSVGPCFHVVESSRLPREADEEKVYVTRNASLSPLPSLLSTRKWDLLQLLFIKRCNGVHEFGRQLKLALDTAKQPPDFGQIFTMLSAIFVLQTVCSVRQQNSTLETISWLSGENPFAPHCSQKADVWGRIAATCIPWPCSKE